MTLSNLLLAIGIAAGAIGGYVILKGKNPPPLPPSFEEETVEGEVAFDDLIAHFKNLHLKREDGDCCIVSESVSGDRYVAKLFKNIHKDGYKSLALLVLNTKENKIVKAKIVHARSFDSNTLETLGDKGIIRLT